MRTRFNYNHTLVACFIGYIVQAIVNNFLPLLFLTFNKTYGIPLSKITALITINFCIQMLIDLLSAKFVDKIGYRASAIIAHLFSAIGFLLLTILPDIMSDAFAGILISVAFYAVGGGLLEVIISPITEACPTENKEKAMSMLHSFYCWGHVGVVLLSTLFFYFFGISNWKYMALIWMLVPLFNLIFFSLVPINHLIAENETGLTIKELFKNKLFWLTILLMICAGASEQGVSQWCSTFAELGLGVSKTLGDLMGPMFFAICMGSSRAIYGKYGDKLNLQRFMVYSTILCIFSYLLISLCPISFIGLLGCGICGFSVGIMWPGTFSLGSSRIKNGGTLMFALYALAGDIGCSGGPTLVGLMTSTLDDNMKLGILCGIIFPIAMLLGLFLLTIGSRRSTTKN